jgi:hypothetical protein
MSTPSRTRSRSATAKPKVDAACAAAVDLARAAAEEIAEPGQVGEPLGVTAEGDRVATHLFACLAPGYRGWHWAVTVARASRSKVVTVDEAVLLPGQDALLAPEWLPWSERLRPGDLGVGDLLLTEEDDPRLEPGYAAVDVEADGEGAGLLDADEDAAVAWELGLGRHRVLSPEGRADAAERWYAGDRGPAAPIAQAAPARCATCGFFVLLAGSLRQLFGACANEYAPDDGKVVSVDHGCGAHSEAQVAASTSEAAQPVLDDLGFDVISVRGEDAAAGSVVETAEAEDVGHS